MKKSDIIELIEKSRADGAQLYSAADNLHKLAVFFIGVFALLGLVLSFAVFSNNGFFAGFATVLLVLFICFVAYAMDIVATNGLKVLVHIMFSNIFLMQNSEHKIAIKGGDEARSDQVKSAAVWRELNEEEKQTRDRCLKKLSDAGYEFVGEDMTNEGFSWVVKSKYGNAMTFAGLEELKDFCKAYEKAYEK